MSFTIRPALWESPSSALRSGQSVQASHRCCWSYFARPKRSASSEMVHSLNGSSEGHSLVRPSTAKYSAIRLWFVQYSSCTVEAPHRRHCFVASGLGIRRPHRAQMLLSVLYPLLWIRNRPSTACNSRCNFSSVWDTRAAKSSDSVRFSADRDHVLYI